MPTNLPCPLVLQLADLKPELHLGGELPRLGVFGARDPRSWGVRQGIRPRIRAHTRCQVLRFEPGQAILAMSGAKAAGPAGGPSFQGFLHALFGLPPKLGGNPQASGS